MMGNGDVVASVLEIGYEGYVFGIGDEVNAYCNGILQDARILRFNTLDTVTVYFYNEQIRTLPLKSFVKDNPKYLRAIEE